MGWAPPEVPPPPPDEDGDDRLWRSWQALRDIIMFLAGLAGIVYEAGFAPSPRVELLTVYAVMLGLPAVFRSSGGKGSA